MTVHNPDLLWLALIVLPAVGVLLLVLVVGTALGMDRGVIHRGRTRAPRTVPAPAPQPALKVAAERRDLPEAA